MYNSRPSSPMDMLLLSNNTAYLFSASEVSRNNSKWIQNFQLPSMGDECIDDTIEASVASKLARAGHVSDVKPLYIAGEGKILMKLNSSVTIENTLAHLVPEYFFNIFNPTKCLCGVSIVVSQTVIGESFR
ncbi:Hypothetical predicted protein [Paramuricea clavata]|uniref:Uncharacterized protein n=1 Tax=Paramuricea clavata TaxID=317549 RepID=A0A6S7JFH6_PARCT|nr:Hypothetical predicted protein [Paramuricea clavata]